MIVLPQDNADIEPSFLSSSMNTQPEKVKYSLLAKSDRNLLYILSRLN